MFCSVLHTLRSPQNVGTIIRTHVAFGGGPVVFVGHSVPWEFKKGTQSFSRKLERLCELVFLDDDEKFFQWSQQHDYKVAALEISEHATMLPEHNFPDRTALAVGNERTGLSEEFMNRCDAVVSIPQFGDVECLNVAVSCSIAMYELNRNRSDHQGLRGTKFLTDT